MSADAAKEVEALYEMLGEAEELDPELEAYKSVNELGWTMIRHPLVYSMLHTDSFNHMVNQQLRQKQEALARALREKKWHTFVWLHERPYRIDAFTHICYRLGDKAYWNLLGRIWVDTENVWQNTEEWRDCLSAERRYRSHLMNEDERAQLRECYRTPIWVYRGYSSRGTQDGMSWTTNPIVAKFFARRLAPRDATRYVAQGTVRKRDVIAFFDGRSEHEIVVLPEHVRDVKITTLPGE